MGYQGLRVVLPTRFLTTIGYFIVTILAFYHKDQNIASGLKANAGEGEFEGAEDSFLAAWGLSIIGFAITLMGLLTGTTMLLQKVNLINILMHFLGAIFTSFFIVDEWHYRSFWAIVGIFSLIPALVETGMFIAIFGLNAIVY